VESLADGPGGGFRCHTRPVVNATRSTRPRASLRLFKNAPKDAPALFLSAGSVSLKNGSVDPPRCAFLRCAGWGMPPDLQGQGRASASRSSSRALGDPLLDVVAPPAWVHPSPKVRGGVRCSSEHAWGAKMGQQPCAAGAACSKRATKNCGLASGAGQINCCALTLFRGKLASWLTRHKANCTTKVLPRARPRGARQHRFGIGDFRGRSRLRRLFIPAMGTGTRSPSSTIS
jgi:hypothetical protein